MCGSKFKVQLFKSKSTSHLSTLNLERETLNRAAGATLNLERDLNLEQQIRSLIAQRVGYTARIGTAEPATVFAVAHDHFGAAERPPVDH